MADRKKIITEYISLEQTYKGKKQQLDEWKARFETLGEEVTRLASSFEAKYEQFQIPEAFPEDIIEKLENRREGIRLSVKSASRLLRKLNPDKPLEEPATAFISAADIVRINEESRTEDNSVENGEAPEENGFEAVNPAEDFEVLDKDTLEPVDRIEEQASIEVETAEDWQAYEESSKEDLKEEDKESESVVHQEAEIETEYSVTEFEESLAESIDEDKTENESSGSFSLSIADLQEALTTNRDVLQELDDCLEAAEKRFLSFIEKGIAPVYDGLFSGNNHANEYISALAETGNDLIGEVSSWLRIYSNMMKEIEGLLGVFHVNLYKPMEECLFDEGMHEPIGVVEDPELQDEQVKEIVRYGLLYSQNKDGAEPFLIRPAQVIVVKNKKPKMEE